MGVKYQFIGRKNQSNFVSDADVNNWAESKLGKDLNSD